MDTESLRAQLAEALASVQHPRSPLLLEPLLHNPEALQTMVADLVCRDFLQQIAVCYQSAEPRYRMLRLIQRGLSHYDKVQARRRIGKSLHDIKDLRYILSTKYLVILVFQNLVILMVSC